MRSENNVLSIRTSESMFPIVLDSFPYRYDILQSQSTFDHHTRGTVHEGTKDKHLFVF